MSDVHETSTMVQAQFVPTSLKELSHHVTCFTNGTVVFVKYFTVDENLPYISGELISAFIAAIKKIFSLSCWNCEDQIWKYIEFF